MFYFKPSSGDIYINNEIIDKIILFMEKYTAYLPQDVFIINNTII